MDTTKTIPILTFLKLFGSQGNFATITDVGDFASAVVALLLTVAGLASFIYLTWGGVSWILSGSDKGKLEEAKSRITNAIMGLAITAAAWAIFLLVDYFLGLNIAKGGGGAGSGGGGGAGGSAGQCGGNFAQCKGVDLNICPGDVCNKPGATQCLGTKPGNAGIVRCTYLNLPANTCNIYYWKWETSCNNLGCSAGKCQ